MWNAAGVLPDAVPQLAPESVVWVGDPALSPEQHGLVAFGVLLGSPAFMNRSSTPRGWQRPAFRAVDEFCFRSIFRELDPPAAVLLDSQAGPFAARILTARPTSLELPLAPSHF